MRGSLRLAAFLLLFSAGSAAAQVPAQAARPAPLKVFLDCQYRCDTEFIVKELTFVDHVRDSQSADIHAMVTTEDTGGGGMRWTIKFIGHGRFEGHDETVAFTTAQTSTEDDRRKAVLRWLKLGLATHAAVASGRDDIDITHTVADAVSVPPPHDPWKAWVFSLNANGHLNGEATSKYASYRLNASASRVTEAWKINVNGSWNRSTNEFEVDDEEIVKSLTTGWDTSALVVKSLGPQWSAAASTVLGGSTFSNYDLRTRTLAGVEYDFFPYAESTRRR